jgi:GT2 family glycosyltransferase
LTHSSPDKLREKPRVGLELSVTEMKNRGVPKVGVITLNWNNYADTSRLLNSLKSVTYPNLQIYVVDNGSTDGSASLLCKEFSGSSIKFVFNEDNLGFSAGCNRGIEVAMREECGYILLLNNDCIVRDPQFLDKAMTFAQATPDCGIVGGKILLWPDTDRIWSTGGYLTFWGAEKYIGLGEIDRGQYQQVEERKFISGALMLIKREVLDVVGMLPEVYFFGKEDWEYSTRTLKAGFKLFYCPDFTIYHEGSHSHRPTEPFYIYNSTLSKILYKKRNHGRLYFKVWMLSYSFYLKILFKPIFWARRRTYLRGIETSSLRKPMLIAMEDAPHTEAITLVLLNRFRERYRQQSQSS